MPAISNELMECCEKTVQIATRTEYWELRDLAPEMPFWVEYFKKRDARCSLRR